MPRVINQSDVDSLPAGATLTVEADWTVTPMATERARTRGVKIVRGAARSGGSSSDDSRDLVRSVTRAVVGRLGSAEPRVLEAVVSEVLSAIQSGGGAGGGGGSAPGGVAAASFTTPRGATFLPIAGASSSSSPSFATCATCVDQEKQRQRSRAVLTTTGKNTKGIVARLTARIADLGGDILDISQTLIGDYFTMIIVIDVASLSCSFERFGEEIQAAVKELGCQAMMMHEDVMSSLHRV